MTDKILPGGIHTLEAETLQISDGSSADYYKLPEDCTELQDLIEHNDMNFSVGNIFKACYRLGKVQHSDADRDLKKIVFFAERELARLKKVGKQKLSVTPEKFLNYYSDDTTDDT